MFKIDQKVLTSKGPGIITGYKRSTYSNNILFYYVKLDSTPVDPITKVPDFINDYLCPLFDAKEII